MSRGLLTRLVAIGILVFTIAAAAAIPATVPSPPYAPRALPDPTISVIGCANVGSPCTLTATSLSNASQTGWTYQWKLNTSLAATTAAFTPTFSAPGTYTVELTATNAFGSATATRSLSVAAAICTGAPHDATINSNPTCQSGCTTSTTIQFSPYAWGYTIQTCDTFAWNFGDGSTSTLRSPSHQYAKDGSYTVRLTISNTNGSAAPATWTINIDTPPPPPPPTCPTSAPSNIYFSLTAPSGCSASNPICSMGDAISFLPSPWGYSIQSCDTFFWNFGDGSNSAARNPTHVYANPGKYPVTLTVSNDKGAATSPAINVVIPSEATCDTAPGRYLDITYSAPSGCSNLETIPCAVNEVVAFLAAATNYTFQSCDTFAWDFGDGTAKGAGRFVTHKFSASDVYTVRLTVSNGNGSSTAQRKVTIGAGAMAPVVDFAVSNSKPIAGESVTFTSKMIAGPVDAWSWDFGDGTAATGPVASHAYANAGSFTVTLRGSNSAGTSEKAKTVIVAAAPSSWSVLLPVVTHLDNADGTKWQTDLHFFNPSSGFDPASPLTLQFEFNGQKKTLVFDRSTDVRTDFLFSYLTTQNSTGSIVVRGSGSRTPILWTRTYIVGPTGVGTFGQMIPAVPLTSPRPTATEVLKQYLAGLRFGNSGSSSKFRTNLGLVNTIETALEVTVALFDRNGVRVGTDYRVTVPSFSLMQLNDGAIRASIPQIEAGAVYTAEISSQPGIVGYASIIDNASNDPIFVEAVTQSSASAASRQIQLLPGLSHIPLGDGGMWRSDVSVLNADDHTIVFDLDLLGTDGSVLAATRSVPLPAREALQLDDFLTSGSPVAAPAGTSSATLRFTTTSGSTFPIIYARTYNDRAGGTFGQGIPAFSAVDPNVTAGRPAYIPGVRSNSLYYTNLGLVSASSDATAVKVSLLDPTRGLAVPPVGEKMVTLRSGESLILGSGNADFLHSLAATIDESTLKIEVVSGGPLWAFASVIDRTTKDPEYVPAVPEP